MSENLKKQWLFDWGVAVFLFAATAAFVAWQNSRLTVLYDLCGVLENANRIALGDIPYRDFPFPYAPLTFLIQAAIIKLTGAVYWHHIAYAAMVGGLATVLAWRIILNLLRDAVPAARLTAFLLSLPLAILGIYCIFPHPFYDPDCVFILLLCILFLQILERKNFPPVPAFFVGVLSVVTLFIKQNIGLAFLSTLLLSLLVLIGVRLWRHERVYGFLALIGGVAVGLAACLLIINSTAGLDNYWHWTITFATMRRTPSLLDMLSIYQGWELLAGLWCFAMGAVLLWKNPLNKQWQIFLALIFFAVPFVWTVFYLLLDEDNSERAERLVGLFPLIMVIAFVAGIILLRRLNGITSWLPFILIGTLHGVFLSQQLWGSTYAVWALLMILIAVVLSALFELSKIASTGWSITFAAIVSITLLISGGFYVYSNERLDYVDFEDGEMAHSNLPPLAGLSMRGDYLPDFEELVQYTDKEIPREDGILLIPGEDLFYYTTGRYPHFSVLLFDYTNNPYTAEEIRQQAQERNIQWLIVKNDLQIEVDKTIDDKDHILEVLRPDFKHVESLNNYEIFKRKMPGESDDEDDDSDDSDSDNSDNDDSN